MTRPHYVLVAHAALQNGRWSFQLGRNQHQWELQAADTEPVVRGQRLELLAVIRGLEAVDRPARVTLWSAAPGLARRIQRGLLRWEHAECRAARNGAPVAIEDADLWRRIDRVLRIHRVEFRRLRGDELYADWSQEPYADVMRRGLRGALARLCMRLVPWAAAAC